MMENLFGSWPSYSQKPKGDRPLVLRKMHYKSKAQSPEMYNAHFRRPCKKSIGLLLICLKQGWIQKFLIVDFQPLTEKTFFSKLLLLAIPSHYNQFKAIFRSPLTVDMDFNCKGYTSGTCFSCAWLQMLYRCRQYQC